MFWTVVVSGAVVLVEFVVVTVQLIEWSGVQVGVGVAPHLQAKG